MNIKQTEVIDRIRGIWQESPLQASCLEILVRAVGELEDRIEVLEKVIEKQRLDKDRA